MLLFFVALSFISLAQIALSNVRKTPLWQMEIVTRNCALIYM